MVVRMATPINSFYTAASKTGSGISKKPISYGIILQER